MSSQTDLVHRFRHSSFGTYAAYVAHGLRHPALLRPRASYAERAMSLDGDTLVREPDWIADFTAVIGATADEVWPWLAQMGYGRGGFYGWYRHDNGGVASADVIVPALQRIAVGDIIPDGPNAKAGFGVWRVMSLMPERALVLFSRRNPWTGHEVGRGEAESCVECSWAFALTPLEGGKTRLHVRVRAALRGTASNRVFARIAHVFLGVGDSVMENTMLDGIKVRAEAAHATRAARVEYDWPWFD
jgi:hypothetical protein